MKRKEELREKIRAHLLCASEKELVAVLRFLDYEDCEEKREIRDDLLSKSKMSREDARKWFNLDAIAASKLPPGERLVRKGRRFAP